jgi:uncharacterized membrane protein
MYEIDEITPLAFSVSMGVIALWSFGLIPDWVGVLLVVAGLLIAFTAPILEREWPKWELNP